MMGKPIAIVQVPEKLLYSTKEAARYLGIHEQTLRKRTDEGRIKALRLGSRRAYRLDELNRFVESLSEWYAEAGEESGFRKELADGH